MGVKISHITNKEILDEECLFEQNPDDYNSDYDDGPGYMLDLDENGFCIPFMNDKERRSRTLDLILSEGINNLKIYWPNEK